MVDKIGYEKLRERIARAISLSHTGTESYFKTYMHDAVKEKIKNK